MLTVTLIPGSDPPVIEAVREIVQAAGVALDWDLQPLDEGSLPRVIASASTHRVVFKGRTGPRAHPLNSLLRRGLDLFASTRRCMTLEGVSAPAEFADALVIRDNTRPGSDLHPSSRRAIDFAFRHVAWSARRRLSLAATDGEKAFSQAFREAARNYPQIRVDEIELDPADTTMVGELDAVLLTSRAADALLWDRLIEAVGGAAVCGGASHGSDIAVFEADPAVEGDPRPMLPAHLLSAAMMLEHLNEGVAADRITKGVKSAAVETGGAPRFLEALRRSLSRAR